MIKLSRYLSAVLALAATAVSGAGAQGYPSRPIRIIVSSPPGNPSDLVVRAAAQELALKMGQPLVVENRVGANTIIAQEACAKAAPDGYTLCVVDSDGMSYAPHFFPNLPYDPDRDYKPVTRLYFLIDSLIVSSSLPVRSVKELKAFAAANAGLLNFGTLGPGSTPDIFRLWLVDEWKAVIVGVPYRGANFIFNALLSGEIQVAKSSLGNAVGLAQGGKIRILAINAPKRLARMPDVPIYEEVGLDAAPAKPFYGIAVPANTADAIVNRLNAEFVQLFRERSFVEFMENRYLEIAVGTPGEFASFLKVDREKIGRLIKKYDVHRQ